MLGKEQVTAMVTGNPIPWVLGALVFFASVDAVSAHAAARHCTSEECACEAALQQNTIEALEAFLKKYPQSTSSPGSSSACASLGVPVPDKGATDDNGGKSSAPVDDNVSFGG